MGGIKYKYDQITPVCIYKKPEEELQNSTNEISSIYVFRNKDKFTVSWFKTKGISPEVVYKRKLKKNYFFQKEAQLTTTFRNKKAFTYLIKYKRGKKEGIQNITNCIGLLVMNLRHVFGPLGGGQIAYTEVNKEFNMFLQDNEKINTGADTYAAGLVGLHFPILAPVIKNFDGNGIGVGFKIVPKIAKLLREPDANKAMDFFTGHSKSKIKKTYFGQNHTMLNLVFMWALKDIFVYDELLWILSLKFSNTKLDTIEQVGLYRGFFKTCTKQRIKSILKELATHNGASIDLTIFNDTCILVRRLQAADNFTLPRNMSLDPLHDYLAKEQLKIDYPLQPFEKDTYLQLIEEFPFDGEYKLILPMDNYDLKTWGTTMKNCVFGYAHTVLKKEQTIAAFFLGDEIKFNVQIYHSKDRKYEIGQFYGPCNSSPPEVIPLKGELEELLEIIRGSRKTSSAERKIKSLILKKSLKTGK